MSLTSPVELGQLHRAEELNDIRVGPRLPIQLEDISAGLGRIERGDPARSRRDLIAADLAGITIQEASLNGLHPPRDTNRAVELDERARIAKAISRLGVPPAKPYMCRRLDQIPPGWKKDEPLSIGRAGRTIAYDPARFTIVRPIGMQPDTISKLTSAGFEATPIGGETMLVSDRLKNAAERHQRPRSNTASRGAAR